MSIKNRIYFSFFLLVSLFVINGVVTIVTLNNSKKLSKHIAEVVDPSIQALGDFKAMMINSKMYSTNWVFLRYGAEDKDALLRLHNSGYPELNSRLKQLSSQWQPIAESHHENNSLIDSLNKVCAGFDQLLLDEKYIMSSLKVFEDYDDPEKKLGAEDQLENTVLPKTLVLIKALNSIISAEQASRTHEQINLEHTSVQLRNLILFLAASIILLGIFLSVYMSRIIIIPINKIRRIINDLGKGIIRNADDNPGKDEIGEMVHSVNNLSEKLKATAKFASEVGNRNFKAHHEPLSAEDALGKALIAMRDNLQSTDESLNEAQHIAQLGSWEWDIKNNKISWSDELYRIYDLDPGEVEAAYKGYTRFIHPEDREHANSLIAKCLLDHKPFSCESRIITKKGILKIQYAQGKVFLNEKGEVIRMYGVTQDVTARKEAENVLIASNLDLKKSNMELDKFVYSVSHDLRAPLLSMLGIVEISEAETTDAFMQENLGFLKGSIKKLDGFIKDILEYSRNARTEIQNEEINFKEMLENIAVNMKITGIADRNVDIRVDIYNEKHFMSDRNRINVVLNNLIANAIRYQNPSVDDPFVNIKIDMSDTETNITVKDNGIGISKENQEKIFDMFYRVAENSVGSGLGLYIARETVNKLHGSIKVESQPGVGTTFQLNIPNLFYQ